MDSDTNADFSGMPMTPTGNSNRHELLWENLPNCTDTHWEEIGRTPIVVARPRNYSKAVNLSERRRSLSEGQDWFDDSNHTDFEEVYRRDKFASSRDASSQVFGRFKDARNSSSDVSEEWASSKGKSSNRERKISVGPRVLDSRDFISSSDDVLFAPVFYTAPGTDVKRQICHSTTMHTSGGNRSEVLLPKNTRNQISKDISRAAKQLKYFDQSSRSTKERSQRTGSRSATVMGSNSPQHRNGYSRIEWPAYEGLRTRNKNSSEVDGRKLAKEIFQNSNQALAATIDQHARSTRNPQEFPTSSDEEVPHQSDGFASSSDSYEHSTSKNSCSHDTSPMKAMFAWNICFDPTPMKSDSARSTTEKRQESFPSTSRQGMGIAANQFQPGTSRKKWDKTSKKPSLENCAVDLENLNFDDGQPDLLNLGEDNGAEHLANKKYSQRSVRQYSDQWSFRNHGKGAAADAFTRTRQPCELKEMSEIKYSDCRKRDSLRNDIKKTHSAKYFREKRAGHHCRQDNFDGKRYRKQESNCKSHGKERYQGYCDHHCESGEFHSDTTDTMESLWNGESCRHGCANQACPIAAYLPILLAHCCNLGMIPDCACKRKIYRCCTKSKLERCSRRRKPCTEHEKPRRARMQSYEEFRPDYDGAYDEVDRELDVEVDGIDGKTYLVAGRSEANRARRGDSLSFLKPAEPPVLLSYRRSVDTETDTLEAEQKNMSSQTEPTTSDCATQAKPAVRHSLTQYSAKVNHCSKDTQCVTHTASVCTQAVVFEPLERATQFPERRENHHKQTQCNLATSRKSVQVNLKYRPAPGGYNYGAGTSYNRRDDYYHNEDYSFRSSQSSYMLPPDSSTNFNIVAPKRAPQSAVVALAAATASADFQSSEVTRRELCDQRANVSEISPVTFRCSVMSARPVEILAKENNTVVSERSGEDCVDEARQRTHSVRTSSMEILEASHGSRNRGKSVSFPTDIAKFFDHPSNSQRRAASEDSDSSDGIMVGSSLYRII